MAKAVLFLAYLSLYVWLAVADDTCKDYIQCTCSESEDQGLTKQEGIAAAVGVMSPIVLGGAGFGIYKLIKGAGSAMPESAPEFNTPRPSWEGGKRDSLPSYRDSPPSYRGLRRGSTPVSMFGEDDDISFNDSSGFRPDSTGSYPNVHRPKPADGLNRWM